jgi:hypothetical protein
VAELASRAKRMMEAPDDLPQEQREGLHYAVDLARAAYRAGDISELSKARAVLLMAIPEPDAGPNAQPDAPSDAPSDAQPDAQPDVATV